MSSSDNPDKGLEALQTMMDGFNGWMDEQEKSAIKRQRLYAANAELRERLVKNYMHQDTWLLFSEAFPLAFGSHPQDWGKTKKLYASNEKKLATLAKSDAGVSLKLVDPAAKPHTWRVKPNDFIDWIKAKAPKLAVNFEAASSAQGEAKKKKPHGNAEVHAQRREQILAAALGVLAAFHDQCKSKGKVSGQAIVRVIEMKAPLWFGDDDLPMSQRHMAKLINDALKVVIS